MKDIVKYTERIVLIVLVLSTIISVGLFEGKVYAQSSYQESYKAVVVVTADDVTGGQSDNVTVQMFGSRGIKVTLGVVTGWANWGALQLMTDNYSANITEIASHSRTHPKIPYGDNLTSEVVGSTEDILEHTGVRPLAWLSPYAEIDSAIVTLLETNGYVVERGNREGVLGWDGQKSGNLWRNVGYTIRLDAGEGYTVPQLNGWFGQAYNSGGIYHIMLHPGLVDWDVVAPHLDYIAGRADVWYAGLGELYKSRPVGAVPPPPTIIVSTDDGGGSSGGGGGGEGVGVPIRIIPTGNPDIFIVIRQIKGGYPGDTIQQTMTKVELDALLASEGVQSEELLTEETFADKYSMSLEAARDTIERFRANPEDDEFLPLTPLEYADLMRVAVVE